MNSYIIFHLKVFIHGIKSLNLFSWYFLKKNPNLSGIDIDALHAKYLSSGFDFKQLGASAANERIETKRADEQQEAVDLRRTG